MDTSIENLLLMPKTEIENLQNIDLSDSNSFTSSSSNTIPYDLDENQYYTPVVEYQQRSRKRTIAKPLIYRDLSV